MNNLPKVVTQQRRGRASNPRLLDRKSDALPLSHRATPRTYCATSDNMHEVDKLAVDGWTVIWYSDEGTGRGPLAFDAQLGGRRPKIAIPFGNYAIKLYTVLYNVHVHYLKEFKC